MVLGVQERKSNWLEDRKICKSCPFPWSMHRMRRWRSFRAFHGYRVNIQRWNNTSGHVDAQVDLRFILPHPRLIFSSEICLLTEAILSAVVFANSLFICFLNLVNFFVERKREIPRFVNDRKILWLRVSFIVYHKSQSAPMRNNHAR